MGGFLIGWALMALCAFSPGDTASFDVQHDLKVPMRDGTVLLGDLWLPTETTGALPVILVRTPYGRLYEKGPGRGWTSQGYAVFIQAVRGRDGSEGVWIPWESEIQDGYDTLEWLANQPWCNGRIGMTGGSYLGHVQILAAVSGHPALRCIVPLSPGSDGFSDVPFGGGIFNLLLINWLYSCRDPILDLSGGSAPGANRRNLALLPLSRIDEAYLGTRSEIWQHWVGIESLADMPGLNPWSRLAELDHVVPALHIDGIWDHESMATRRNWEQFTARDDTHQHIVYGPWPHEPNASTRYGGIEYGSQSLVDLKGMVADWYDYWLRGEGCEDAEQAGPATRDDGTRLPHVQQFVTGANAWLHTDSWPASDATDRTFFLGGADSGHRSRSRKYQEALFDRPAADITSWTWRHDPAVTEHGSRDTDFYSSTRLWFKDSDKDALVLVTPAFEADTLLTGPAELEVTLGSSAADTDLFAVLLEVDRRGVVRALQRTSPLRIRFREGFDRAVPMEAGQTYRVVLPFARFAHLFKAGTCLGIGLRSEWFPDFARNLGTLEPQATATRMVVQENRILSGGGKLSALRLHELPLNILED